MIGSLWGRNNRICRWGRSLEKRLRTRLKVLGAKHNRLWIKARVIAITGSSGKSTTTSLLSFILEANGSVESLRSPLKTTEIVKSVANVPRTAEYYVVELSIGEKGHLRHMLDILRPDIGIVTFVGIEHHKIYRTRENVATEKSQLVEALPATGIAFLNSDDGLVHAMRNKTAARVVTFGRGEGAAYRATAIHSRYPEPLSLEVEWRGKSTRLETRILGEQFWLSVTAAFAAAVELGVPVDTVKDRIAGYMPLPDRCQPYEVGAGKPAFILDTKKAPWQTVGLAINVMRTAQVIRKWIVVGTLSDYPGNPKAKYRDTYRDARSAADRVVFVGEHSHRSMASEEDVASGRFVQALNVKAAADLIKREAKDGDLILLKGSRAQHLERIALSFQHDVKCWKETCGRKISCFKCGLFKLPFEEHSKEKEKGTKTGALQ